MMMASDFSQSERDAVYRAIQTRRDVRAEFTSQAVPDEVLLRVLGAAHCAPSVGLSQPWRFIVVREAGTRLLLRDAFERSNVAANVYEGAERDRYAALRLQGILEAPVNICVVCDDDPQRGRGLGRQTMPETARYSTVCAIQNLWLAARVEDLGIGWVSIIDPAVLHRILAIPEHLAVVAYLCVGYVDAFAPEPDLLRDGWEKRVPLDQVVNYERYAKGPEP